MWDLFTPDQQRWEADFALMYRLDEYRFRKPVTSTASQLLPVGKRLLRACS